MSKLKICSQNIRGLRGSEKCLKVIYEIERRKADIFVLVDTHFNQRHHDYFKNYIKNYNVHSNLVEIALMEFLYLSVNQLTSQSQIVI